MKDGVEKSMNWMKRMCQRASQMPDIRRKLEEVERWEKAYLEIKDSLTQEQQTVLEAYMTSCEELDHAILCLAHEEESLK